MLRARNASTPPEPRPGLTDYQGPDQGPDDGPSPRLNALLHEVDQVERTMHQLRARLAASEAKPAPAENGTRHRATGYRPAARSATKASWTLMLGAAALGLAYLFAGPTHLAGGHMTGFDVAAIALALVDAYLVALAFTGREPTKLTATRPRGKAFFVLAIPAREGAAAVSTSVRQLLAIQYDAFAVVVVDCGNGSVAEAAGEAAQGDRRVMVERLPGGTRADALNHAVSIAGGLIDRQDPRLGGVSAAGTLLGLLEPGAWLEPASLRAVARQFDRQHCAATQVHVRILDARHSIAAAIEGLETAAFHVIAQTARDRSGTVQLTATGAFFRIGALHRLDPNPWTGSLDDELDIALRLIELGHRIRSCRDTCAYRMGTDSLQALRRSRRRRARARRQASPHVSRLWETRRISIVTRVAMTLDLLIATPLLAPAAILASVLAVGLALLPSSHSSIAGLLHGGIGARAVVLVLFVLPLAALCLADGGTSRARRRRARGVPEAEGISPWALPGVAFALLITGLLRLLPGPNTAPGTVYDTAPLPFAPSASRPPAREVAAAEDLPGPAREAAHPVALRPAPLRPAPTPLRPAPLRAAAPTVAADRSAAPTHGFDSRDAESIQNWVRSG